MTSQLSRKFHCRGTFTVIAMIVMALGTMGMLSLIAVMNARMEQVNSLEDRAIRHVREMNGRQLAKAYAYQRFWTTASGGGETVDLPGNWGRIVTPSWSTAGFATTNQLGTVNQVSPSPDRAAYAETVDISVYGHIDSGTGTWSTTLTPKTIEFQVCSRALNLSDHLFESRRHTSSKTVSGNLRVHGKSAIWQHSGANNTFAFATEELVANNETAVQTNFAVTDLSGAALAPNNLVVTDLPNWFAAAGSTHNPSGTYPKFFDDDWGPFNDSGSFPSFTNKMISRNGGSAFTVDALSGSSVNTNGVSSNGAGVVTVDLRSLDLVDTIINNVVTLTFTGQSTPSEALAVENQPVVTYAVDSASLATLNFTSSNARPLVVALSGSNAVTTTTSFDDGGSLRLFLIAEQQPLSISSGGSTNLYGGLATDEGVAITSGTIDLYAETTNPTLFEDLLWRSYWVESYLQ
tara:strand:+ start:4477 stop:5862 length:1386 start_codon:yes stop_codon:yes gene_type:complete